MPTLRSATLSAFAAALLAGGCDRLQEPPPPDPLPAPAADEAPADGEPSVDGEAGAEKGKVGDADAVGDEDAKGGGDAQPEDHASKAAPAKPPGNYAFFSIGGKGWIVLGDDGFSSLPKADFGADIRDVQTFEGRAYGPSFRQIMELRPEGLVPVDGAPEYTGDPIQGFAIGPDGSFWLLRKGEVSHLVDGAWEPTAVELDPAPELYTGLAVDAEGAPYVATAKAIYRRAKDAWEQVEFPGSQKAIYLQGLGNSPSGDVYLPKNTSLYLLSDGSRKVKTKAAGYGSFSGVVFAKGDDGTLHGIVESSSGASYFLPTGKEKFVRTTRKTGMDVGLVTAAAVDGQGRVWIGGDGGFAVDVPGAQMATFPTGSVEEVSGKVDTIVVLGQGPKLPKKGEMATGTLTGVITRDGAPHANAKLEICPRPSTFFTRSPCTGELPNYKSKTDAEGKFTFADIPLGTYGIAIKTTGRNWRVSLFPDLGTSMKAGETYDVGSLAVDTKKK